MRDVAMRMAVSEAASLRVCLGTLRAGSPCRGFVVRAWLLDARAPEPIGARHSAIKLRHAGA